MISRFIMMEKFLITASRAAHDEECSTCKSMIFFTIRNVRGARCSTTNKIFERVKSYVFVVSFNFSSALLSI